MTKNTLTHNDSRIGTYFSSEDESFKLYYSRPIRGSKAGPQKLTLNLGGKEVKLNGRQLSRLRKVISA